MEYEGMRVDVVASGMSGGRRGSTGSATGTGAGGAFEVGFFFLGFFEPDAAPPAPAQQRQQQASRRSHCQICMKEP